MPSNILKRPKNTQNSPCTPPQTPPRVINVEENISVSPCVDTHREREESGEDKRKDVKELESIQPTLKKQHLFSPHALSRLPTEFKTHDDFFISVLQSTEDMGITWLHAIHIAINFAERNQSEKARKFYEMSLTSKQNPIAYRGLALLAVDKIACWTHYQAAWNILRCFKSDPSHSFYVKALVAEICLFLSTGGPEWNEARRWFVSQVPRQHHNEKWYTDVLQMMKNCEYRNVGHRIGRDKETNRASKKRVYSKGINRHLSLPSESRELPGRNGAKDNRSCISTFMLLTMTCIERTLGYICCICSCLCLSVGLVMLSFQNTIFDTFEYNYDMISDVAYTYIGIVVPLSILKVLLLLIGFVKK